MANRKWLKTVKSVYSKNQEEFILAMVALGADYVEVEADNTTDIMYGVFICPMHFDGSSPVAIKFTENEAVAFGSIDDSCMNYTDNADFVGEEIVWILKTLNKLKRAGRMSGKAAGEQVRETKALFIQGERYPGDN